MYIPAIFKSASHVMCRLWLAGDSSNHFLLIYYYLGRYLIQANLGKLTYKDLVLVDPILTSDGSGPRSLFFGRPGAQHLKIVQGSPDLDFWGRNGKSEHFI